MSTSDGRIIGTTQILNNGSDINRFNIALLSEGYQAGQMAQFANDALYAIIRGECRRIMAGAIFDRPSWGGDDPLTRVLIDGLEGAERARRSEEKP